MLPELKIETDIDIQNVTWDDQREKLDRTRRIFLQFLADGTEPDDSDIMQNLMGYRATTVKRIPITIDTQPFTVLIATNAPRVEDAPMTDDQDIDIILSDEKTPGQKPKITTFTLPTRDKLARFNKVERLGVYKALVLMDEDLVPLVVGASLTGQQPQTITSRGSLIEAFTPSTAV